MNAIVKNDFQFEGQKGHYVGKVRDVYNINDDYLVMVVSDRISAFDVVLPKGIPFKGQMLIVCKTISPDEGMKYFFHETSPFELRFLSLYHHHAKLSMIPDQLSIDK